MQAFLSLSIEREKKMRRKKKETRHRKNFDDGEQCDDLLFSSFFSARARARSC